jgi:hypothetical protein
MGPEFEPYLPCVMPALLQVASAKADVAVYGMFRLPNFFDLILTEYICDSRSCRCFLLGSFARSHHLSPFLASFPQTLIPPSPKPAKAGKLSIWMVKSSVFVPRE